MRCTDDDYRLPHTVPHCYELDCWLTRLQLNWTGLSHCHLSFYDVYTPTGTERERERERERDRQTDREAHTQHGTVLLLSVICV